MLDFFRPLEARDIEPEISVTLRRKEQCTGRMGVWLDGQIVGRKDLNI